MNLYGTLKEINWGGKKGKIMDLLKQKLFFKLKTRGAVPPSDDKESKEYKKWRNEQKTPISSWTDENNRFTYSELANHPNVGMAIPKGYILIDIDDKDQANKIHKAILSSHLKCMVSNTGKGKHFLFKDPKGKKRGKQSNGDMALVGIKIDSRVPSYGDSQGGYVVVKFYPDIEATGHPHGERFTTMLDLKELDDLPFWLEPITKQYSDRAREVVATEWKEGNRDDSLRTWTTILWNTDISKRKELDLVIGLINDYIMDSPVLTSRDFNNKVEGWVKWASENKIDRTFEIGKEDQEYEAFGLIDGKSAIDYINLSEHITALYGIAFYDGNWWMKRKNPWYDKVVDEDIYHKFIEEAGNVALKADEKKFFNALKVKSKRHSTDDTDTLINFKNGRYDIKEEKLYAYTNSEFLTFGIDVDFKEDAKCDAVDNALHDWTQGNQDEVDALMEFTGSIMYSKNSGHEKGLILYGPNAKNGKSTFLEMMTNLFSREYISAMNFRSLESQFGAYSLIGKKLISIPELEDTYIESSPKFKSIITGDPINIEGKNIRHELTWYPILRFIGATNRFPRFNDQTNGIWRRLIIIPFDFQPTKKQEAAFKKKNIMNEEARERLALLAVKGLVNYLNRKGFTIPARSKEIEEKMKIISNPVHAWSLDDHATHSETMKFNDSLSENFTAFKIWCGSNNYKALGKLKFREELLRVRPDLDWKRDNPKAAIKLIKIKSKEEKDKDEEKAEEIFGKENIQTVLDVL